MTFSAKVLLEGQTATGFEVPPSYVEELQGGKRPAVVVTINGYSYRSTVMPYDGKILLPLALEHRSAAGIKAGDTVEITLVLDTAPRTVEVPADLASALDAAGLRTKFDQLAFTHRKEHVRAIEDAKGEDTRKRRIAKALDMVKEK